jgi:hypothetical protein
MGRVTFSLRRPLSIVALASVTAVAVASAGLVYGRASEPPIHAHHRQGSIIGSETPELIPDSVAFHLVLRLIADLEDGGDQQRLRAYLNYIDAASSTPGALTSADKDRLLAAARDHKLRSQQLVTLPLLPGGTAITQTPAQTRNAAIAQTVSALPQQLTPHGHAAFVRFVQQSAKRSMKRLANGPSVLVPPGKQAK